MPKLRHLYIGYNKVKEIVSSIRKTRDSEEELVKTRDRNKRVFSQIVKDEPDETLEAWRILVEKVPDVRLEEGDFTLSVVQYEGDSAGRTRKKIKTQGQKINFTIQWDIN